MSKKKVSKTKLSVVKRPKLKKEEARNAKFAEMVQAFTVDLQGEAGKFGIKPEDLTVTVHIQLRETPKK